MEGTEEESNLRPDRGTDVNQVVANEVENDFDFRGPDPDDEIEENAVPVPNRCRCPYSFSCVSVKYVFGISFFVLYVLQMIMLFYTQTESPYMNRSWNITTNRPDRNHKYKYKALTWRDRGNELSPVERLYRNCDLYNFKIKLIKTHARKWKYIKYNVEEKVPGTSLTLSQYTIDRNPKLSKDVEDSYPYPFCYDWDVDLNRNDPNLAKAKYMSKVDRVQKLDRIYRSYCISLIIYFIFFFVWTNAVFGKSDVIDEVLDVETVKFQFLVWGLLTIFFGIFYIGLAFWWYSHLTCYHRVATYDERTGNVTGFRRNYYCDVEVSVPNGKYRNGSLRHITLNLPPMPLFWKLAHIDLIIQGLAPLVLFAYGSFIIYCTDYAATLIQ